MTLAVVFAWENFLLGPVVSLGKHTNASIRETFLLIILQQQHHCCRNVTRFL
jgi:hypothetical protein